jgi:hypothetical protein
MGFDPLINLILKNGHAQERACNWKKKETYLAILEMFEKTILSIIWKYLLDYVRSSIMPLIIINSRDFRIKKTK